VPVKSVDRVRDKDMSSNNELTSFAASEALRVVKSADRECAGLVNSNGRVGHHTISQLIGLRVGNACGISLNVLQFLTCGDLRICTTVARRKLSPLATGSSASNLTLEATPGQQHRLATMAKGTEAEVSTSRPGCGCLARLGA
jgi:hypothetical protein